MTESPETPTPSLEALVGWLLSSTCPAGLPYTGNDPATDHGHTDCLFAHTAAAQLRQLDRIKAALPLVDMIRRMVDACRNVQDQGRPKNVEWFDWVIADLERIADALEADDG